MNKSQLIKAVAEKSELSQKQIGETWKLFEQTILETLNAGERFSCPASAPLRFVREPSARVATPRPVRL